MWRVALSIFVAVLALQADSPGITVDPGGPLIHRTAVEYTREAAASGIAGTVVLEVSLDKNGEVTGAEVVSGPAELRHTALRSVVDWHYSTKMTLPAKVRVGISFNPAVQTSISKAPAFRMPTEPLGNLLRLEINGLTGPAREALAARLPFHEGDPLTPELVEKARQTVSEFDAHLAFSIATTRDGSIVRVVIPGGFSEPPPQRIVRGNGNMVDARLIEYTAPEMPALAKRAGIAGIVKMAVSIGGDGHVTDVRVISGHPLLVPAAVEAVKTWVYRPTLLNGNPIEITTQVDLEFPPKPAGATP